MNESDAVAALRNLIKLLDDGPGMSPSWWQWKQDVEAARQRGRAVLEKVREATG